MDDRLALASRDSQDRVAPTQEPCKRYFGLLLMQIMKNPDDNIHAIISDILFPLLDWDGTCGTFLDIFLRVVVQFIIPSRILNFPTEHSNSALKTKKGMADSIQEKLSIKLPDIEANSTQPSDAEGEKEAGPSPPPGPLVSPPPNGGRKAWLQVAGSFLIVLNTW